MRTSDGGASPSRRHRSQERPGGAVRPAVRYVGRVSDKVSRVGNVSSKVHRNALRAGAVTGGTALMLLLSSPAFALARDDGDDPGPGLSVIETLGLFVAIPAALYLVIAALVMLPGKPGKKQS
jgi:hypothetical protein